MSWFDDYDKDENTVKTAAKDQEVTTSDNTESDTVTIPKEEENAVPEMSKRPKPVKDEASSTPAKEKTTPATVIDETCIIEGNLKTERDLMISGAIQGSIHTSGNVTILPTGFVKDGIVGADKISAEGNVNGNISGHSVELKSGVKVRGDISASNDVQIDKGCVVIGAVSGENLTLEGAVKGDITTTEKLDLKETAIVKGSVTASALNICPGAILDGACNLTNKKCDYKAIFGEE